MNPQQQNVHYSKWFVLLILSSFTFVMLKSLGGGIPAFDQNILGRSFLIINFNHLRYLLGDHVFPQVLLGKQDWMEFTADGNLDDYQNAYMAPETLEGIRQKLEKLHEDLAARNITLIVVVAPNKATIYPEKMAGNIKKLNKKSRLDTFLELMRQSKSDFVIDLRPALIAEHMNYQLYYKTDTHWNALGAYIAYRETMTYASQIYPSLRPHQLDEFKYEAGSPQVMDLAHVTGMNFIQEAPIQLKPKFNSKTYFQRFTPTSNFSMSWGNNGQEQTMLIYHDSFGIALQPFLQTHFKQAMYIQDSSDTKTSSLSWVNKFQPNIVIIEIAERDLLYLDTLLSN